LYIHKAPNCALLSPISDVVTDVGYCLLSPVLAIVADVCYCPIVAVAIIADANAPRALLLHSKIDAAGHANMLETFLLLSFDAILADVELDQCPIVGRCTSGCQSRIRKGKGI
jgi:hypothetical protein